MSVVQSLREFISEKLTSAVDEIFTEVEKTIVQYEEVIDRQRRLLDLTWKPQIKLTRTDPPQRHVLNGKETQNDHRIRNQDREPKPDQEEPAEPLRIKVDQEEPAEPLRIKVDQEEPAEPLRIKVHQEEPAEPLQIKVDQEEPAEPLRIKVHQDKPVELLQIKVHQEEPAEPLRIKVHQEEPAEPLQIKVDQEEPAEPLRIKVDQEEPAEPLQIKVHQDKPVELLQIKVEQVETEEPEPNPHLLLPPGSVTTETPGQEEGMQPDSDVEMPALSLHSDARHDGSSETSFNFENGGVYFKSRFPRERGTAADHVCLRCGKAFRRRDSLVVHVKSHMGQYGFTCEVCGRGFIQRSGLMNHIKIHSDDRPYTCKTCGKSFRSRTAMMAHMRSHQVRKMFQSKLW